VVTLEKATTRRGKYPNVQYARFADDRGSGGIDRHHPRHEWLIAAVEKRLREEITKLRVEINEEKSRKVDLSKGGSTSAEFKSYESKYLDVGMSSGLCSVRTTHCAL
jgi:RNA-directed DNA polymerase